MKRNLPNRKSIRLKGYDYTQAGLYFVTICTQNREHFFGEIKNGQMILNDAGKMIEKWYDELEHKFMDIKCGAMVIMPNHFHCIIQNVGADLRVCPNGENGQSTQNVRADLRVCPNADLRVCPNNENGQLNENGQSHRIAPTGVALSNVIQWFKTMTTNEYIRGVKSNNWKPFDGKLWQRNYWEHIIRNDNSYHRITQYIIENPSNWGNDKLNNVDEHIIREQSADYGNENWNNIL